MNHNIANLLGTNQKDVSGKISELIPGYMAMNSDGMQDMATMHMGGLLPRTVVW